MKKLIIIFILLASPFIIFADDFDDMPSTGNPIWYYFEYKVTYPDGDTNSGNMKVCASNVGVAISTGRRILNEKYGKNKMQLRFKGRGESCSDEGTGELE
jgi:hypothetical protein